MVIPIVVVVPLVIPIAVVVPLVIPIAVVVPLVVSLIVVVLGVVVLGPLFEEVLFRGFLFKGLEKSFLGGKGAVFITALVFSCIHVQYGFWVIFFMLFPMALLLGYARLKSKSLFLPIILHSINNLITCLITHFEVY